MSQRTIEQRLPWKVLCGRATLYREVKKKVFGVNTGNKTKRDFP